MFSLKYNKKNKEDQQMRLRNTDNPHCRQCPEPHVLKNGKTNGIQKYKCPMCNHMWHEDSVPTQIGRKPLDEVPMTNAERYRKWYAKKKQEKEQNM
jgi:transposase-like protein